MAIFIAMLITGDPVFFVDFSSRSDEMTTWETCEAVERHPKKVSGAWVFRGTRVPISALFENLKDGATTKEFLAWFPGIEKWQVEAVLEHEVKALEDSVIS